MKKDLNRIKKLYGEDFAKQFCRKYFSHILEREDSSLVDFLVKKIAPSRFFYEDLVLNHKIEEFKQFVWGHFNDTQTVQDLEIKETPEELMKKAGYTLYKCETFKDMLQFKRYYSLNEEVCSFYDPQRINTHTVFWAVKDNVDQIKREDFPNPERQDDYGTSVISIQFTKGIESTVSIKNRYNNSVEFSDATFSNDLEQIQPGLTESFKKYYNINLVSGEQAFKLPGYVVDNNGTYYKYNYHINDIYYCVDNTIIINGNAKHKDPTRYILADYYLIDREKKTVNLLKNSDICDSFVEQFYNIRKIDAAFEGDNKVVLIYCGYEPPIQLVINKYGQIIKLTNNNIVKIDDEFMKYNTTLAELNISSVEEVGDFFLSNNKELEKLDCPRLKMVGKDFLYDNLFINNANFPKLKSIQSGFMENNTNVTRFYAPLLSKNKYGGYLNSNFKELKRDSLIVRMIQKLTSEILPNELWEVY